MEYKNIISNASSISHKCADILIEFLILSCGFEALIANAAIRLDVVPMRTDVSEKRITSIFRVANQLSKKPECSR
jgi:hypothetical protein